MDYKDEIMQCERVEKDLLVQLSISNTNDIAKSLIESIVKLHFACKRSNLWGIERKKSERQVDILHSLSQCADNIQKNLKKLKSLDLGW